MPWWAEPTLLWWAEPTLRSVGAVFPRAAGGSRPVRPWLLEVSMLGVLLAVRSVWVAVLGVLVAGLVVWFVVRVIIDSTEWFREEVLVGLRRRKDKSRRAPGGKGETEETETEDQQE